jgi:anti-sigma regulatory factor (Ser/Thr protein kinase)
VPPELLDKAQLIASELVANGVRYDNTQAGGPIQFSARRYPSVLRIDVENPAADSRPEIQPRGQLRSSGYGLIIVDSLADRWGSDVDDAVRIWCELELDTKPAGGTHLGRG